MGPTLNQTDNTLDDLKINKCPVMASGHHKEDPSRFMTLTRKNLETASEYRSPIRGHIRIWFTETKYYLDTSNYFIAEKCMYDKHTLSANWQVDMHRSCRRAAERLQNV